ncbi:hypothetical protein PSP6_380006 [Paraburkholderia tropica]|nr:hypothetical protein PSP6_380006 [Paraburkholderia tropica]
MRTRRRALRRRALIIRLARMSIYRGKPHNPHATCANVSHLFLKPFNYFITLSLHAL